MRNRILTISAFFLISLTTYSQTKTEEFSILFYNVENLFDLEDDPDKDDEEYLLGGPRNWNKFRFDKKLNNISKVILSSSGWHKPAIVGLCEIENRNVLESLLRNTPLRNTGYKIIHKESPDRRGIDVAMLYDPLRFYPLSYDHFVLKNKKGEMEKSREILHVSGIADGIDTLHLFVNHWPSRYSGVLETREKRKAAAALLKAKVDSLFCSHSSPKIIIVGDFNDQPDDDSVSKVLEAIPYNKYHKNRQLYNLSYQWMKPGLGTLKYRSQWFVYDQIIVSGFLLDDGRGYSARQENAIIINTPFLIEPDDRYGGKKPYRTYYGYNYIGGFSDHFPVLLKLGKE